MPSMEMGSNGNASGAFLLMWLPMTIAMMLPLGMPVMLKFHTFVQSQLPQQQAWERSGIFVLGWLLPWALFGFAADLALFAGSVNSQLSHFQPINVIAMTLIAGLYQFTPLKLGFLQHHQSPCFTSSRQGVGIQAAFSMGLQHGFCCVGSCWGLMLVMLAFGAMTWVLMGLATITILVERSVPWQSPMRHMLGLSLLALAIWTAVQAVGI